LSRRFSEAPGPTWVWVLISALFVMVVGYTRLAVFPDRFVPLSYGLPLLIFLWRRDLRLLWGTSAAFAGILVSKLYTLLGAGAGDAGLNVLFASMQILSLLIPAAAIHAVIRLTRSLEQAGQQMEATNSELEATNEELAAREEEISQQNEELQIQSTELEQQAEELSSQAAELQQVNEQLTARERTLSELMTLSASGADEGAVLANLGEMVAGLFPRRAVGAAILQARGDHVQTHALFGMRDAETDIPAERSLARIIAVGDRAGYLPDLALRQDLVAPLLADGQLPRSVIAAPTRLEGADPIVLEVYSGEPGDWSELDLQLAQWCAEQCGKLWTITRLREDLGRLADSEREARSHAERAAREKDEFVATLAHELRTPIGAVLGWANLLRTIKPDELKRGLDVIERNARQQARLISDLLDISRATSGKLHLDLQFVDVAQVVDAAIDVVKPSADEKGIRLVRVRSPIDGRIVGDPDRLQQVVWNLLTNAIKFTPRDGSVEVSLTREDSRVRLTISDNGQGIEPKLIPFLFERYRQADSSSSRSHGGLGLGLAIVKHLVELHGGGIELLSAGTGQGTTCLVTLPVGQTRSRVDAQPSSDLSDGAPPLAEVTLDGLSVLIVDDDPDTLEFIARVLADRGAAVSTATSAAAALEKLERSSPNLLVSDIGMPGVDGYELIRRVRQHAPARVRRVPAIAMTAFARSEDRTRALLAGFQVHLPKPIETAELVAAVASFRDGIGNDGR
jgi:signal transduction histidine kinase/ActR/RegA family two-component response regulator